MATAPCHGSPPTPSLESVSLHTRSAASLSMETSPEPPPLGPEYVLLGDSVVRYATIPNCVTYSFSGAKVLDLREHLPHILHRHPSVHTVIVHAGLNDIRTRCTQSAKLYSDYEVLANEIEDMGKFCFFSGLIPTLQKSPEIFSRIYSADNWLRNFCLACGYGYSSNFDLFWKNPSLYRDSLHPNNDGIKILAKQISSYLSKN